MTSQPSDDIETKLIAVLTAHERELQTILIRCAAYDLETDSEKTDATVRRYKMEMSQVEHIGKACRAVADEIMRRREHNRELSLFDDPSELAKKLIDNLCED